VLQVGALGWQQVMACRVAGRGQGWMLLQEVVSQTKLAVKVAGRKMAQDSRLQQVPQQHQQHQQHQRQQLLAILAGSWLQQWAVPQQQQVGRSPTSVRLSGRQCLQAASGRCGSQRSTRRARGGAQRGSRRRHRCSA
jgi:hypothetical protein